MWYTLLWLCTQLPRRGLLGNPVSRGLNSRKRKGNLRVPCRLRYISIKQLYLRHDTRGTTGTFTAVFTTIDPADSGRHRWSTRTGSAMSHSCQLPSPICLPPAMGSMFLADAVTGSRGADEGKIPVCGKTCTREGVNMNPRDFKKVAPSWEISSSRPWSLPPCARLQEPG